MREWNQFESFRVVLDRRETVEVAKFLVLTRTFRALSNLQPIFHSSRFYYVVCSQGKKAQMSFSVIVSVKNKIKSPSDRLPQLKNHT